MNKKTSLYRWPAEWESQSATWIAWPHNRETWPQHFENVPAAFQRFVMEIARYQQVEILAGPPGISPNAMELVGDVANVRIHEIPTNDCWIRDFGPTFVQRRDDSSLVGIRWHFNAWGGKYTPYDDDAAASLEICQRLSCPHSLSPMHCEGGALEGNGGEILLTTSSCLLSPNRNPGWTNEMVESELRNQLGVSSVVWVDGGGLEGDDTDSHIDQLARFISPDIVVAATSSRSDDPNATGLSQNVQVLRDSSKATNRHLTVHELPTPPPRFVGQQRVPESYCNFLFVNGAVLLPTFRSPVTDRIAIDLFKQLVPDRQIIPLDAHDLAWGLGAFHCASQHQPMAK